VDARQGHANARTSSAFARLFLAVLFIISAKGLLCILFFRVCDISVLFWLIYCAHRKQKQKRRTKKQGAESDKEGKKK
jgi:hypothetical protein